MSGEWYNAGGRGSRHQPSAARFERVLEQEFEGQLGARLIVTGSSTVGQNALKKRSWSLVADCTRDDLTERACRY